MYDELIERLRDIARNHGKIKSNYIGLSLLQAADAIEELATNYDAATDIMKHQTEYIEELEANKPRWIPVTERLPEKPEGYPKCEIRRTYYLVALKSGCVKTLGYEFDRDEWQITGSPVVAWMPLPEPPKEE